MIEQRIVVIFEKWILYLQKNDCKIKWLDKINEYIECEMLIFVAWWLTQCKNYWMSHRVYISKKKSIIIEIKSTD